MLGGSQGAAAINDVMPGVLQRLGSNGVSIMHQTGKQKLDQTVKHYQEVGFELSDKVQVTSFIEDMPSAYAWCDLVICRSGASTVSEIAAAGKPSILIPYPHHRDNQQVFNANWLVDGGAACMMLQQNLSVDSLSAQIQELIGVVGKLKSMAEKARGIAILNADKMIADECLELANA